VHLARDQSWLRDPAGEQVAAPPELRRRLTREPSNEAFIENVVDLMPTGIAAEHA
jgi:hypothetical protein